MPVNMRVVCEYNVLLTKSAIRLNPKIQKMVIKCSNPLMRHTKECSMFWSEVETFNDKILKMEYGINKVEELITNRVNGEEENLDFCSKTQSEECLENSGLDGCKTYDV